METVEIHQLRMCKFSFLKLFRTFAKNKNTKVYPFFRFNPVVVSLPGKCLVAGSGSGFCYAFVDEEL